ncbi:MAG TPA: alkaline phosphatase family protein [Planctomycetota bacterium]|nr:alkaline phosphatase family protein [Planctomycetota bacterium]
MRSRLVLAPLLLAVAACGDSPAATPAKSATPAGKRPKVAIFGVDGATFQVMDPLLAAGKLPALGGLIARGARTVLQSDISEGASAVLWASIATAACKAEHGIEGFTQDIGGRNVIFCSYDRKLPALWTMVDARGGSVGIVGYWNSWPAETVNGWIVADLFATSLYRRNYTTVEGNGITWPPELVWELAPLVAAPADIRREDLDVLGQFTEAEWAALSADDSEADFVGQNGLVALKYGVQAQKSFARAALHMLDTRGQPDLLFVFLELPDRVGHNFWHAYEPDKVRGGAQAVDAGWRERWAHIVPGSYEIVDDWIGQMLAKLDPDTTVFVVSDHGFRSGGGNGGSPADLAHVGHSGAHAGDGVLIAAGPAIASGATCEAQLYDVAPTVLAAMGLPGTTQGIGRVLRALLAPAFLAQHPLLPAIAEPPRPLADHDSPGVGPASPDAPPDEERLRQLKAIGYMIGATHEVPGGDDADGKH